MARFLMLCFASPVARSRALLMSVGCLQYLVDLLPPRQRKSAFCPWRDPGVDSFAAMQNSSGWNSFSVAGKCSSSIFINKFANKRNMVRVSSPDRSSHTTEHGTAGC